MFRNYPHIKITFILICALFALNSYAQSTTYNNSTTITIPTGVTKATVQAWGAGGNGGDAFLGNGGGGGGGAYSKSVLTGLLGSYDIVIGSGNSANAANKISEFKPTGLSALVSANGGAIGSNGVFGNGTGGAGGSVGTGVLHSGGNGANGAGGGGSSAGTISNGNNAIGTTGGVAVSGGGEGGDAGGVAGGVTSGGGGGAIFFGTGGKGGNGRVIVCLWPTADYTNIVTNSTRVVDFTNTSTSNSTSYLWDFGDSNTSTATNPTHTYAANGTYNVKLTSTNACGFSEVTYSITLDNNTLGIDDEVLSLFSIYPNPVSIGEIKMKLPNEIEKFDVTISSVLGQELFSNTYRNGYNVIHNVDVSNYKSGIYFMTVSTPKGKATKRLIIR